MSAAAFVLAINVFVAGLFATAFGIVAAYQRPAPGATWLSVGYGTGVLVPILEFILPYQRDHRLVSFAIFAAFLLALVACVLGLAYHYRLKRPWLVLAIVVTLSLLTNIAILDMPRESLLRGLLYQAPYTLVQAIGVAILLRHKHWRALDLVLLAVLFISSLHFLGKPILASIIGSGTVPQDYLTSSYAAFSQSLGAILLITNGLIMLLVIMRDMMADMTSRSETDSLSKLLNRRGFEDRCDKALVLVGRTGTSAAMIVADLDHFKWVNDSFGHEAGDKVISTFASILRDNAGQNSIIGRLGGEEFAILIPGANPMTGKLHAESARIALFTLPPDLLGLSQPVSASFGIAGLRPGDTLSDLLRRADAALYQAKTEGRNRVCLFLEDFPQAGRRLRDKAP